jgi:hypothetical protein
LYIVKFINSTMPKSAYRQNLYNKALSVNPEIIKIYFSKVATLEFSQNFYILFSTKILLN